MPYKSNAQVSKIRKYNIKRLGDDYFKIYKLPEEPADGFN